MNRLMNKVSVLLISVPTMLATVSFSVAANADEAAELIHMKRSNLSIEPALVAISDKFPGQINEVELDDHKNQFVYEAEVVNLSEGKLHEVVYNPLTGMVELKETENISLLGFNRFDDEELKALKSMDAKQFSLLGQLAKVKQSHPGLVREVELENEKGVSYYKIKLMSPDGVRKKVILDTENGEMIPVMDRD
ncbi:PepSY domain-containing protein [Litoribrevibacter euphylliae]|uniref:PepSY domain-containing protein n=2 Tax=Litoribrevibacter euphylliae TaxID=1834034 RepID=A0ABV7HC62_9GAMM